MPCLSCVCTRMHSALHFGVMAPACCKRGCHAREAVRIVHFIRIDGAVVDFLADLVERARIDAVAREVSQRLGMVEDFARAVEVLLHFRMLRELRGTVQL